MHCFTRASNSFHPAAVLILLMCSIRINVHSPSAHVRTFACICINYANVWTSGDGVVSRSPAEHRIREAEVAVAGASPVPGERVAARRAGRHPAASAAERAEVRHAWRGTDAPAVHEWHATVRSRVIAAGLSALHPCWSWRVFLFIVKTDYASVICDFFLFRLRVRYRLCFGRKLFSTIVWTVLLKDFLKILWSLNGSEGDTCYYLLCVSGYLIYIILNIVNFDDTVVAYIA